MIRKRVFIIAAVVAVLIPLGCGAFFQKEGPIERAAEVGMTVDRLASAAYETIYRLHKEGAVSDEVQQTAKVVYDTKYTPAFRLYVAALKVGVISQAALADMVAATSKLQRIEQSTEQK